MSWASEVAKKVGEFGARVLGRSAPKSTAEIAADALRSADTVAARIRPVEAAEAADVLGSGGRGTAAAEPIRAEPPSGGGGRGSSSPPAPLPPPGGGPPGSVTLTNEQFALLLKNGSGSGRVLSLLGVGTGIGALATVAYEGPARIRAMWNSTPVMERGLVDQHSAMTADAHIKEAEAQAKNAPPVDTRDNASGGTGSTINRQTIGHIIKPRGPVGP
jgi:hypothetical protein